MKLLTCSESQVLKGGFGTWYICPSKSSVAIDNLPNILCNSHHNLTIPIKMANPSNLPEISHYITSYDPEGKSTFLTAPNPPLVQQEAPSMRVDYIYSTPASTNGPTLKDLVDYKHNEEVRKTHPHVLFPLAGGSSVVVASVSFHSLAFYVRSILQRRCSFLSSLSGDKKYTRHQHILRHHQVCTKSRKRWRIYASVKHARLRLHYRGWLGVDSRRRWEESHEERRCVHSASISALLEEFEQDENRKIRRSHFGHWGREIEWNDLSRAGLGHLASRSRVNRWCFASEERFSRERE